MYEVCRSYPYPHSDRLVLCSTKREAKIKVSTAYLLLYVNTSLYKVIGSYEIYVTQLERKFSYSIDYLIFHGIKVYQLKKP